LILRNFATWQLKGYCQIPASVEIARQWHEGTDLTHFAHLENALAQHYQIHEQLPHEKHGGSKNVCLLLKDELLKAAAHTWLTD